MTNAHKYMRTRATPWEGYSSAPSWGCICHVTYLPYARWRIYENTEQVKFAEHPFPDVG
jgi:hypothetical protein